MTRKKVFRLDKAAYMTEIGEQNALSAMYGAAVRWFSTDEAVATVTDTGLVMAVGNGDALVVAETSDGERAECIVSVGYHGQNPLLPPTWGLYIADGEPHVFDGRMYICGSRDNPFGINRNGVFNFCSEDYHVIYSDDLLHWTDAGVAISIDDFPEELQYSPATNEELERAAERGEPIERKKLEFLWAPDLFRSPREEKYYMTFCACEPRHQFFMAESASPTGPFENVREITYQGNRIPNIDPGVLVDDDGRVYLAMPAPFRLGELDPDADYAKIKEGTLVSVQHLVEKTSDGYYSFEGPSLRKFNGRYYFIYIASKQGEVCPVRMNYLISDSIREGWRFGGMIIDTYEYQSGCNVHGSAEAWEDRFYLSYHRVSPGFPSFVTREMSMDELHIREDGAIQPVTMTSSGVRGAFVQNDRIPSATAVFFSGGRGDCRFTLRGEEKPAGSHRWRFTDYAFTHFDGEGQYNGYRYVDLDGCTAVTACVRTRSAGGSLLIRDTEENEVIATLTLPDTAEQWAEITAPLRTAPLGKREITVALSSAAAEGEVELDWFRFF